MDYLQGTAEKAIRFTEYQGGTHMKKVYSISFISYTNCLKNTVSHNTRDMTYLHIPDPCLIFEDDIEKYMEYGGGIKDMIFVGYILENND